MPGTTSSGVHVFTHNKSGKNSWQEVSAKLKEHGYQQSKFDVLQKGHTDQGFVYKSVAHFDHPDGHKAVIGYFEGGHLGAGQGETNTTLAYYSAVPPVSKVEAAGGPSFDKLAAAEKLRPPISTTSQHYAKKMTAILKKIDAAKQSPNPTAALAALQIDKSVTPAVAYKNALLAAYQAQGGPAPSVPAAPAPVPVPEAVSLSDTMLLQVAEGLRPKLSKTSVHYAKKIGVQLKKIDAALKSPNPAAALAGVKIPIGLPAVNAYKNALMVAHKHQHAVPAATPTPAPAPSSSSPAKPSGPAVMQHGGTAKMANGQSFSVASMDLSARRAALPAWAHPPGGDWSAHLTDTSYYQLAHDQRKGMTQAQIQAASSYQGSGYREINKYLANKYRTGAKPGLSNTPAAELEAKIGPLQTACLANSVPRDAVLTRGVSASLADILDLPPGSSFDPDQAVGGVFVHHGFVSTSRGTGFHGQTTLKVSVKAGQPGLTMPALGSEREILLPAGSVFRIKKVVPNGNHGGHTVHVEYEGPSDLVKGT